MTYTDEELGTIITVRDARRAGACVSGQFKWCRSQGMDWRSFISDGVRLRDIHDKDDGDGNQIVARVVERMRGVVCGV